MRDASQPISVLVVDDDPAAVEMLKMRLGAWGYTVLTATNGPRRSLSRGSRRAQARRGRLDDAGDDRHRRGADGARALRGVRLHHHAHLPRRAARRADRPRRGRRRLLAQAVLHGGAGAAPAFGLPRRRPARSAAAARGARPPHGQLEPSPGPALPRRGARACPRRGGAVLRRDPRRRPFQAGQRSLRSRGGRRRPPRAGPPRPRTAAPLRCMGADRWRGVSDRAPRLRRPRRARGRGPGPRRRRTGPLSHPRPRALRDGERRRRHRRPRRTTRATSTTSCTAPTSRCTPPSKPAATASSPTPAPSRPRPSRRAG